MHVDRVLRDLIRERFVITLVSGETFDGLLDRVDASTIDLVDAQAISDKGDAVKVDGHLYLPRANVAYMQRAAR